MENSSDETNKPKDVAKQIISMIFCLIFLFLLRIQEIDTASEAQASSRGKFVTQQKIWRRTIQSSIVELV